MSTLQSSDDFNDSSNFLGLWGMLKDDRSRMRWVTVITEDLDGEGYEVLVVSTHGANIESYLALTEEEVAASFFPRGEVLKDERPWVVEGLCAEVQWLQGRPPWLKPVDPLYDQ